MKKEQRNYSGTPNNKKKSSPFFNGILLGLLLGVGVSLAAVLYFQRNNPFFTPTKNESPIITAPAGPPDVPPPKEGGKPATSHYDFYNTLKNDQSKSSPDAPLSTETPHADNKPSEAAPAKPNTYLQIGAYTNTTEADNLRAKLALQGLEALVQTATLADSSVLYRVRIGPLSDATQVGTVKSELTRLGYTSNLVKDN